MAIPRIQRRAIVLIGLGVAVPALVLAGLGIHLSLRIARAVEKDSARYCTYLAQQVVEAFEQELLAHLRGSIGQAESAARRGAEPAELIDALETGGVEFEAPHFVPLMGLDGYSMLMVESQPVVYSPGVGEFADYDFAGLLLRDENGQVMGAGGWWVDPHQFLAAHIDDVIRDRLPRNPRMYGGLESAERMSVELLDTNGTEIGRVREPGDQRRARSERFVGPFEGFAVRIAPTSEATVTWTGRFVTIQVTFIAILGLVLVTATLFGLRYLTRQLELAQIKAGFVSNVTHELKTPIALIRLAVETLELRRVRSPEETEKFLKAIDRETLRLSQLVDNILDFARLEAGQHVFRFEAVDLGRVVRDAVESLRPRLEHQGFTCDVDLPESLPPVRGDATALTHCVLNLLDNAMKYSRTHREVEIAVEARGEEVAISVTDRGIGIAPGDQKRIFDKFVRVETGLVHDVRGAGLGLSLVDQIVRGHGGHVEVTSSVGEGSTFTLVLPAAGGLEEPEVKARPRADHEPIRGTIHEARVDR